MHTKVFEVLSQTSVKGIPLQVKTLEAENTREDAARAHGLNVLVAHPRAAGRTGLITGLRRREDLETWATDKAREALERARHDSRRPRTKVGRLLDELASKGLDLEALGLSRKPHPSSFFGCFGCFIERVWAGDETHRPSLTAKDHTCGK